MTSTFSRALPLLVLALGAVPFAEAGAVGPMNKAPGVNHAVEQDTAPTTSNADALPTARPGANRMPDRRPGAADGLPVAHAQLALHSAIGCVRLPGGEVKCWGEATGSLTPIAVDLPAGTSARQVAVAGSSACAIFSDDLVRCWGPVLTSTDLGNAPAGPAVVHGLEDVRDVVEIDGGAHHFCARSKDGTVRCWGGNSVGEAGLPSSNYVDPRVIPGVNARRISVGRAHSCAVTDKQEVICWGSNRGLQMGLTSDHDNEQPPTRVPGQANIRSISAGEDTTCAVRADRHVVCWGGLLLCDRSSASCTGESVVPGTTHLQPAFNDFGVTNVQSVAVAKLSACVLSSSHPRCAGTSGDLGIGVGADGLGPSLTGITAKTIAAGDGIICAANKSEVWCWGASSLLRFANNKFGEAGQAFLPVKLPL
jgi:Regulator of chromosome condensation (RCC1) repeat